MQLRASRAYHSDIAFAVTPIVPSATQRPRGRERRYRAPVGLPKSRTDWRAGSIVSLLVHVGVIALLLAPMSMLDSPREILQGAGGPGPAGGGGGGSTERLKEEVLRYVRVAPPPPPIPEVKKVAQAPPPEPQLPVQSEKLPQPALTSAGIGTANTLGSGPGSGGGVGSGVGTGRGSAVGPGTGGGTQENYPPTPTDIFLPPLPVPESVKGFHLIAEFDVDETGRVLSMTFTETRDRGYNRRLADVLRAFKFRPGTKPDGTPIRMKAQVVV